MSDSPDRSKTIRDNCNKFVNHHDVKDMAEWFDLLSDFVKKSGDDLKTDRYGEGDYLSNFEKEIAELLGKEAAVYMPSGTMAQQIALRIWADRAHNDKVAMHPTAHLEVAEHYAYEKVHHLQRIQWAVPDFTGQRLLTSKDFEKLREIPGSVLLELPQRPLGGQLPTWDDLVAIQNWCKDHGVKLHLDGARIWECTPYYGKTLAEICAGFNSVYVSFYKGLDGIAGCMLAGSSKFIDEARIWQRRMGGNLPRLFPLFVAAKWGLQKNLPLMSDYHNRAKLLAAALNQLKPFETNPRVPQTNMFHLYIRGTEQEILDAHLEVAEETGMWLINGTMPSTIPAYRWTEMVMASASNELDMDEVIRNFELLAEKLLS